MFGNFLEIGKTDSRDNEHHCLTICFFRVWEMIDFLGEHTANFNIAFQSDNIFCFKI